MVVALTLLWSTVFRINDENIIRICLAKQEVGSEVGSDSGVGNSTRTRLTTAPPTCSSALVYDCFSYDHRPTMTSVQPQEEDRHVIQLAVLPFSASRNQLDNNEIMTAEGGKVDATDIAEGRGAKKKEEEEEEEEVAEDTSRKLKGSEWRLSPPSTKDAN